MKKTILQIILLVLFISLCVGGYFAGRYALKLHFRPTNDALHKKDAPINLDFLIPGGTYIDEKVTQIVDIEAYQLKIAAGEADWAFTNTSLDNYTLYKENEVSGGYQWGSDSLIDCFTINNLSTDADHN